MTNYEFWKALNAEIDKDLYGGEFSPSDYNDLAKEINLSLVQSEMELLYARYQGADLSAAILSSKLLRNLVIRQTGLAPTAGVYAIASLSSTYGYWVDMTAVYNGQIRKIKLVTPEELGRRNMNLLSPSIKLYPIATIDEGNIRVYPTDLTSLTFTYIKIPANPVFDYYTDSNDTIVYMTAGATNVSIPVGATYSDGTAGATTKNSTTVEWVYDTTFHHRIYSEMLKKIGLKQRDGQVQATAMSEVQNKDQL